MNIKRQPGFASLLGALTGSALLLVSNPAKAENNFLAQAIEKHDAGRYSEAMSLFGAAEPAEFNNPKLHYYLADTYNRLKLKSDAVREYKIAMSLQPTGLMADYCGKALRILGASPPQASAAPPEPIDPSLKATAWLNERLGAAETERREKTQEAENSIDKEVHIVNKQVELDKEEVRRNIAQFLPNKYGGGQPFPNPEFQLAMEKIDLDSINKINELNMRLKRKRDEITSAYEQQVRGYKGSGMGASAQVAVASPGVSQAANTRTYAASPASSHKTPTSSLSPSATPTRTGTAAATSPAQVNAFTVSPLDANALKARLESSAMRNNDSKLMTAAPAVHSQLGLLPLLHYARTKNRELETTYFRLDSDGTWETDEGRRLWRLELLEDPDLKPSWQLWQSDISKIMHELISDYSKADIMNMTSGIGFRVTVTRNGQILDASPCSTAVGPDPVNTIETEKFLKTEAFQRLKRDGVEAIPSNSRFAMAYFVVFVSEKQGAWWRSF